MTRPTAVTAMFPLSTVLFPRTHLALHVFEERYRAMVADCLAGDRGFGVVLISRGSEVGGGDERVDVGTLAEIEVARPFADGRWALLARGVRRINVVSWLAESPYPQALVEEIAEPVPNPSESSLSDAGAAVSRARALLSELGEDVRASAPPQAPSPSGPASSGPASSGPASSGPASSTPGPSAFDDELARDERAWTLCASAPLPESDRQRLLEAEDHEVRLALLARLCEELADDVAGYLRRSP